MIAVLLYAQATDLVTFGFAASALPLSGEYNVLMPHIGVWATVAVKVLLVSVLALLAMWWMRGSERRPLLGRAAAVFGIAFGSLGALSNVAALWITH